MLFSCIPACVVPLNIFYEALITLAPALGAPLLCETDITYISRNTFDALFVVSLVGRIIFERSVKIYV